MNSVLSNKLSKYEIKNTIDEPNAMKEIIHEMIYMIIFFTCQW